MMREQTDQAFMTTLHRLQPATVQALCEATGVTATAIRQRLLRLQGADLITRGVTRGNRGRPYHTYSITDAGLHSLGDDHAEMAAILWREIKKIEPSSIREQVLSGVKQALLKRFEVPNDVNGRGLADRLAQVCARLTDHGFDVDFTLPSQGGELPILREHNCPYYGIAEGDPEFCEFEQSIFSELLNAPVELTACRQNGGGHCEFNVGNADSVLATAELPRGESPEFGNDSVRY